MCQLRLLKSNFKITKKPPRSGRFFYYTLQKQIPMKRLFILIVCLLNGWFIWAQESDSISEKIYVYDEFQLGTVYYSDGSVSKAMMNYNFVLQTMQFFNHLEDGQILDLVRQPNMTHVKIGKDIFVPVDQGYAIIVLDGSVALLQKTRVITKKQTTGAYGIPTNTVAVKEVPITSFAGSLYETSSKRISHKDYRIETVFYLMKNGKIRLATKRNYLKLYPKIKLQIELYLSEHNVDFNNHNSLMELSKYCNGLMLAK